MYCRPFSAPILNFKRRYCLCVARSRDFQCAPVAASRGMCHGQSVNTSSSNRRSGNGFVVSRNATIGLNPGKKYHRMSIFIASGFQVAKFEGQQPAFTGRKNHSSELPLLAANGPSWMSSEKHAEFGFIATQATRKSCSQVLPVLLRG